MCDIMCHIFLVHRMLQKYISNNWRKLTKNAGPITTWLRVVQTLIRGSLVLLSASHSTHVSIPTTSISAQVSISVFRFTHMRAFIYSIRDVCYR